MLDSVDIETSVMGLKPRFIEYFNYNINTYSDLAVFSEEIKKLLDKQFSVCTQITAHGYNSSDFGNVAQETQDVENRPSTSFFNPSFSPIDYSSGNGAESKHSC